MHIHNADFNETLLLAPIRNELEVKVPNDAEDACPDDCRESKPAKQGHSSNLAARS